MTVYTIKQNDPLGNCLKSVVDEVNKALETGDYSFFITNRYLFNPALNDVFYKRPNVVTTSPFEELSVVALFAAMRDIPALYIVDISKKYFDRVSLREISVFAADYYVTQKIGEYVATSDRLWESFNIIEAVNEFQNAVKSKSFDTNVSEDLDNFIVFVREFLTGTQTPSSWFKEFQKSQLPMETIDNIVSDDELKNKFVKLQASIIVLSRYQDDFVVNRLIEYAEKTDLNADAPTMKR